MIRSLFVFLSLFLEAKANPKIAIQDEHALFDHLMQDYNKEMRPVKDKRTTVFVEISPVIMSLVEVDEKGESLNYNQWLYLKWNDEFLRWNPSNFSSIRTISIPASRMWVPDVVIIDSRGTVLLHPLELTFAKVDNHGNVSVELLQMCTVKCSFDIAEFPFDKQECPVQYGSWSYLPSEVRLNPKEDGSHLYTLDNLKDNTEWNVHHYEPFLEPQTFNLDGHNVTYIALVYLMKMTRQPQYFIFTLAAPSYLITTICLIGLFSPANSRGEREEKVTLGQTTLLTMAVILNIVTGQMPRSNKGLPLLGRFILYEMCVSSLCTCITAGLLFMHEKLIISGWSVPSWLMKSEKTKTCYCHSTLNCNSNSNSNSVHPTVCRTDDKQQNQNQHQLIETTRQELAKLHRSFSECVSLFQCIHSTMNDRIKEKQNGTVWLQIFYRIDIVLLIVSVSGNTIISLFVLGPLLWSQ